jgi:hypothetical protein
MNPLTKEILSVFVKRIDKPQCTLEIMTLPIKSKKFVTYDSASQAIRDQVKKDLDQIAYEVDWFEALYEDKGFETTAILKRISITNGPAFLDYFNIEPNVVKIKKAVDLLYRESYTSNKAKVIVSECGEAWQTGKTCYGCSSTSVNKLVDALKFLDWLSAQDDDLSIDLRTASVRSLSDSKNLERIINTVANLLRESLPEEAQDFNAMDVLAYYGVQRYAPSFRFKASVIINDSDVSSLKPYVELPPEGIKKIKTVKIPSYILFIENKTTFERYTREIDDDAWVFYTNGFPSKSWQQLFREFINALGGIPLGLPVFHWGDIDPGGFKILVFISKAIYGCVTPYRMFPEQSEDEANNYPISELEAVIAGSKDVCINEFYAKLKTNHFSAGYRRHEQEFDPIIAPDDTDKLIRNS